MIFIQNAIEPSMWSYTLVEQRRRNSEVVRWTAVVVCIPFSAFTTFQAYHPLSSRNTKPISAPSLLLYTFFIPYSIYPHVTYLHVGMVEWLLQALLLLYNCTYVHTHCGMRDVDVVLQSSQPEHMFSLSTPPPNLTMRIAICLEQSIAVYSMHKINHTWTVRGNHNILERRYSQPDAPLPTYTYNVWVWRNIFWWWDRAIPVPQPVYME